MVEKKFNFYTIFNNYYKNINKSASLFLYTFNIDSIKDLRPELYSGYTEKMLTNYFGVHSIITSNFTTY
jgi:hypothetical protein